MFKRILSILLALLLFCSALPLATAAVDYRLEENSQTLILSGSGPIASYTQTPWAAHNGTITKVVIEEGITAIPAGSFSALTALESVEMAKSVTFIDEGAFPATPFTLLGWLNHAGGRYAESHANVTLSLKELRILSFGNSHTDDYSWWFTKTIFPDLNAATGITFTFQKVTSGARRMYNQANPGAHYLIANDPTHSEYNKYQNALAKTWDYVVIQDYHESTYANIGGENFADDVATTVGWLREDAPGAKIAWYADVVEYQARDASLSAGDYYARSVAAMEAVAALSQTRPDLIIPASTVLENAYTSYFGTTQNRADVSPDYEVPAGTTLPLVERDSAHLSHLLGRPLFGHAVMYGIMKDLMPSFDYFDAMVTKPTSAKSQYTWKGEFLEEYWPIFKELVTHAYAQPYAITPSQYKDDPFDAKFEQVKTIIAQAAQTAPAQPTLQTLETHFRSAALLAELSSLGLGTIEAEDVTVSLQTVDHSFSVSVDCHYGLTFSMKPAYGNSESGMSLVAIGKLPTPLGEGESTLYQIYLNEDGLTHTVYITNPSYTAATPDYEGTNGADAEHPNLLTLPWHTSPYANTVSTIIVDESINYIGKYFFCANYAKALTDIYMENPNVGLHNNLFYCNRADTGITVHLNSAIDYSGLDRIAYFHFSYLEAEDLAQNNADLWALSADLQTVFAHEEALRTLVAAYDGLPAKAKGQLAATTLEQTTETYGNKVQAFRTALTHTHQTSFPQFDYNDEQHWTVCECGYTSTPVNHILGQTSDISHHWKLCTCGYKTPAVPHDFKTLYDKYGHWTACYCELRSNVYDHVFTQRTTETEHWKECTCGYKIEEGTHTFTWVVDQPASETATGLQHEACTCSATRNPNTPIEKLPHTHDWNGWIFKNEQSHIRYCGKDITHTETAAHTYANSAVCTVCGYNAMNFTDVKAKHWYYDAVSFVYAKGLMKGTGDGSKFEPNTPTSRAMLVTILYRLEGSPAVGGSNPFPDVKNKQWYTDAVLWAAKEGIVTGYDTGKFGPNDLVTREQMATILYRYGEYRGEDVSARADLSSYPDQKKVGGWAKAAFCWANAEGFITGANLEGQVLLNPKGKATRAELATVLQRFCTK